MSGVWRALSRTRARTRGYGTQWDKLSRRARRLQPWCTDCGATERLQADHLPSAWERQAAGKPIRLADVEVVCNVCNVRCGSSRPAAPRGRAPEADGQAPAPGRVRVTHPYLMSSTVFHAAGE